jgi:hypothetical protein
MKVLYRISDGGHTNNKQPYVNDKKGMFLHFLNVFRNYDIYVFADNVNDETYQFLISNYDPCKIFRISLGNARSFMHTVDYAIQHFNLDDKIYFAEDDYIYKKIAPEIIEEGLDISDYSSGYDHPDKYMPVSQGGNPYVEQGGELTRVIVSNRIHWKLTNSCCMTFATRVRTIKEDYDVFNKYCPRGNPQDFPLFCELVQNRRKKLISCIPAVSTHGENYYLSKFIDWDNEYNISS